MSGQVSQVGLRDDVNGTMMVSVTFPSLMAAEACATSLQRAPLVPSCISTVASLWLVCDAVHGQQQHLGQQLSFHSAVLYAGHLGHLRFCIEPDWRAVDSSKTAAMAQLIKLGEWLGCRDSPRALPHLKLACLQRGADVILAAVQRAGGAQALAAADPAAAISLCHGLMQLPDLMLDGIELEFATLGPDLLRTAAADVQDNMPGAPRRAYTASWLANLFLRRHTITAPAGQQLQPQLAPSLQAEKQVAC